MPKPGLRLRTGKGGHMLRTMITAIVLTMMAAGGIPAAGPAKDPSEQQVRERYQELADKDMIIETINQLFIGTDQRDGS